MNRHRHMKPLPEPVVDEKQVELTAYVMWEQAGKPAGAEKYFWDQAYLKVKLSAWAEIYDTRPRPVNHTRKITLGKTDEPGTI